MVTAPSCSASVCTALTASEDTITSPGTEPAYRLAGATRTPGSSTPGSSWAGSSLASGASPWASSAKGADSSSWRGARSTPPTEISIYLPRTRVAVEIFTGVPVCSTTLKTPSATSTLCVWLVQTALPPLAVSKILKTKLRTASTGSPLSTSRPWKLIFRGTSAPGKHRARG